MEKIITDTVFFSRRNRDVRSEYWKNDKGIPRRNGSRAVSEGKRTRKSQPLADNKVLSWKTENGLWL